MAWTTARTWVTGELVTASMLNEQLRDNTSFLAGSAGAIVTSAESTSSTSFTDLATSGPAVTVTTGTKAIVHLSAELNALGVQAYMGYAVSGATTVAADTSKALMFAHHSTAGYVVNLGSSLYVSGLTAGSNTFTAKYAVGSGSAAFGYRHLIVIPLP